MGFEKEENIEFLKEDIKSMSKSTRKASIFHVPVKLKPLMSFPLVDLSLVDCSIAASECLQFSSCSTLRSLNLSCNPIGMQGLQNLLKKKINLETLILYDCQITKTKKGDAKITHVPNLKCLNLSYNPGIVEDFKDWQAVVSTNLLELSLSNCAISKEKSFIKILKAAPNLEYLDLSGNPQLEINSTLAESINKHQPKLRTLLLSECTININDAPVLVLEQLVRLDLSSMRTDFHSDTFVQILGECFFTSIEVLLLDKNSMTSTGLTQLFQLESLVTLQILSVKQNKITRIEGPYNDLAGTDIPNPQAMCLQLLDLTGNKGLKIGPQNKAKRFLSTTIVICLNYKEVEEYEQPVIEEFEEKPGTTQWKKSVVETSILDFANFGHGIQVVKNPNEQQLLLLKKLNL